MYVFISLFIYLFICVYIYTYSVSIYLLVYLSIYIYISRITPYVSHLKPHQIPTWSMLPSAFRAASSSGCALPKSAKLRGVYLAGGSWGYLGFPIYLVDFMENIWFMENKKVFPGKSMFSIFFPMHLIYLIVCLPMGNDSPNKQIIWRFSKCGVPKKWMVDDEKPN